MHETAAVAQPVDPTVPTEGAASVVPGDARYEWLATRGYNKRFVAQPEVIKVVHSAEQVARILEDAVRGGKRVTVRSGGHCFEGLVDDPSVRVLIDVSEMDDVYFDPRHRAIVVEAGATLGEAFRAMFVNWGVTIPAGVCPDVGVAGHVAGGGYGPLSRLHGLVVDHLYAVEVVVVNAAGRARVVFATREQDDPNRELWWAHTGGGGGNFGVVTRFWFRTPGATGNDPSALLPRPPRTILQRKLSWSWAALTESDFRRLVRNHSRWTATHSAADSPYASMHSGLTLYQKAVLPEWTTSVDLEMQIDADVPDAVRLLDEYVAAVSEGVSMAPAVEQHSQPWLRAALSYDPGDGARLKSKGEYLRKPWTEQQIDTVYRYLTAPLGDGLVVVTLYTYGGKINSVAQGVTATAQRDSVMKLWYAMFWSNPASDQQNLRTIGEFYRDLHVDTGGVPLPGTGSDGCYINYADVDMADPQWNNSGVPWTTLYYKDGYARLQQAKARWDPLNVFRHQLSVRPPG